MGCGFSKDADTDGAPAAAAGANGTTKTTTTTTTTPFDKLLPDATQINQALNKFTSRASVVDQMLICKNLVTQNAQKGARNLQNIFATPLTVSSDFTVPSYPKSDDEAKFIQQAIEQNFVFSNLTTKEMTTMIGAFERIEYDVNTNIIQQGDEGDYFYVLKEGHVSFIVNGTQVGTAEAGSTFGELALLYSAPRAATCRVKKTENDDNSNNNKAILYRVDQTTFRFILQTQTQTADQTKRQLVEKISFLKELDESDLNKLVGTMTPRPFTEGEYIVKKGEEGDAFYVIEEGSIEVTDIESGDYENQILNKGDYFGERALVTKEARAANCIGKKAGILLKVDKETFEKVMGNLSALILKASDKRRLAAIKILQMTPLNPSDLTILAEAIVDEVHSKNHVLFKEGDEVESTFYIVREGEVELTSTSSPNNNKTIEAGGFFGDEMLSRDADAGSNTEPPLSKVPYTVTVKSDSVTLGILTLRECRTVLDTTLVGKGNNEESKDEKQSKPHRLAGSSIKGAAIDMKDLTKHAILGAGTFGQVWLVSRSSTTTSGERHAYALKIQSKYELIRHSQAKGVVQEKTIMSKLQHPFIINLVTTYQDKQRVYMLLGIVQGGELFSVLHQSSYDGVPEKSAKFYAAGIHEGLSHMHRRHILYRDLKPENVLIDAVGYPVIVDLGFAKYVTDKTYTLCGTPLYIAPEVVLNRGHDKGADHWSLGVLIFEMITGYTPFYKEGMDQISLFRAIVKGRFEWPRNGKKLFTDEAKDLISRLLVTDPTRRLGSLARGAKDIYFARWFKDLSFVELKNKNIEAPWIPKIKDPLDSSNFESWDHLEDKGKSRDPPISKAEDDIFHVF